MTVHTVPGIVRVTQHEPQHGVEDRKRDRVVISFFLEQVVAKYNEVGNPEAEGNLITNQFS